MGFRIIQTEKDLAGFVSANITETGAMILISSKGKNSVVTCQTEDEVITNAGLPSSTYPSVFEALAFVRKAPLRIVCPYGDDSKWGGAIVTKTACTAFTAGQVEPEDSYAFTTHYTGGTTYTFTSNNYLTGFVSGVIPSYPVVPKTLAISVGGFGITATDVSGNITGAGISGTGHINYANGVTSFTLATVVPSGVAVTVDWDYKANRSADVSHAIFAASPYTDNLAIDLDWTSGSQFNLTLYEKTSSGAYNYITEYDYSLTREKDNFGKSLYYDDVFDEDPYLIVVKNDDFVLTGSYSVDNTYIDFSGGYREAAEASDITTAWNLFQKANKYKANILMDVIGGYQTTLNTLITTYQPYAHGLTTIAMGNDAGEAVTARSAMSLDSDNISIYTNWRKIEDPYNNSYAWISNIGCIGKKYAMMSDVYDSGAPAGIDEDNHGGQIDDWKSIELEYDYSDAELQSLDEAQINPFIWDESYGVMAYGDKTAQVSLSDVSYIGARRMYNYVLESIINGVLKKQVFKNNDSSHRSKAKAMIDDFIQTTVYAVGGIREWATVCDTTNNTDAVMDLRQFVVDLYIKVTPTSEQVRLKLVRVSQSTVIAELIG